VHFPSTRGFEEDSGANKKTIARAFYQLLNPDPSLRRHFMSLENVRAQEMLLGKEFPRA
jgi:hypothetical protein